MERTRRSVLATLGGTLAVLEAGCVSTPDDDPATAPDTSERRPDTSTSEREGTSATGSPAWTAPPTSTPTQTPDLDAADVLPEPDGEWGVESRGGLQVCYIGGETGASAEYTGPDGVRFRAIVVEREGASSAEVKAHGLYCDGWPVTVAHEAFAFAAGFRDRPADGHLHARDAAAHDPLARPRYHRPGRRTPDVLADTHRGHRLEPGANL